MGKNVFTKVINREFVVQSWELSYWKDSCHGEDFTVRLRLECVDDKELTQNYSKSFKTMEKALTYLYNEIGVNR